MRKAALLVCSSTDSSRFLDGRSCSAALPSVLHDWATVREVLHCNARCGAPWRHLRRVTVHVAVEYSTRHMYSTVQWLVSWQCCHYSTLRALTQPSCSCWLPHDFTVTLHLSHISPQFCVVGNANKHMIPLQVGSSALVSRLRLVIVLSQHHAMPCYCSGYCYCYVYGCVAYLKQYTSICVRPTHNLSKFLKSTDGQATSLKRVFK